MSKHRLTEKTFSEWLEDIRDVAITVIYIGLAGICIMGAIFLGGAFIGMLMR